MRRIPAILVLLFLFLLYHEAATAATTSNFGVSATVASSCTVFASPVTFALTAGLKIQPSASVSCTNKLTPYTLTIIGPAHSDSILVIGSNQLRAPALLHGESNFRYVFPERETTDIAILAITY